MGYFSLVLLTFWSLTLARYHLTSSPPLHPSKKGYIQPTYPANPTWSNLMENQPDPHPTDLLILLTGMALGPLVGSISWGTLRVATSLRPWVESPWMISSLGRMIPYRLWTATLLEAEAEGFALASVVGWNRINMLFFSHVCVPKLKLFNQAHHMSSLQNLPISLGII